MKTTDHFDLGALGDMLVHMNPPTEEYTMVIMDKKYKTAHAQVFDTKSFRNLLDTLSHVCMVLHQEMDHQQTELNKAAANFK